MRREGIRRQRAAALDWMGRVRETTTAMVRHLSMTRIEKFGCVSQRWLEEYVAEAGKHDASR